MNRGPLDHDTLREEFSALRDAREGSAGDFQDAVSVGRMRANVRHAQARRRTLLAAALGVPLVAALTLQLRAELRQRADLALAQQAASIADWRSPTDALLTPSYMDLMREIPSLHASVLDARTQPGEGSR